MTQDQHENIYEFENADKTVSDLFSGQLSLEQALQKLRTKLLDLTSRNRLLNYKHPKGRSIQVVNKSNLNLIFNRLIDNKPLLIKYVPDPPTESYETKRPDVNAFAQSIGIDVNFEFPPVCSVSSANKHTPKLQALYYPADLDKLCRKIGSEARTVIEETGMNMLYLIFGFLEFYEREDSEKPQIAPLLAVPVTLEKGTIDPDTRTYQYSITYSGEDVYENQTLREKLSRDFSLQLSAFDEDDDPSTYLAKIQQAIQNKKRWKVRHQLILGFLSFGKFAIWNDLDPKKWPGLLNHPLLKEVFSGGYGKGASLSSEDYDIDQHSQGDLPLIYDADSSQHSAIIDVLSGKNMVINGPPGTGKSQTITNIIAAGLKEGKKILFVSDKLAALEVVRDRLNHANLGYFCLELHSHKTQKKKLLGDLQERLDQSFRPPQQLQDKISTLKRHKKELNRYAELMSIRIGNELGLTIYEVFWRTELRRQAIGDLTNIVQSLFFAHAANWSYDYIEQRRAELEAIGQLYVAIGSFDSSHPWWGFTPRPLAPGDDETIGRIVLDASVLAAQLGEAVSNYKNKTGDSAEPSLATLKQLHKAMQTLPAPPDNLNAELLLRAFTVESPDDHKLGVLKEFIHKIERARELNAEADALLSAGSGASEGGGLDELSAKTDALLSAVCKRDAKLKEAHLLVVGDQPQVELSKYQDEINLIEDRINCVINEIWGYARQIGISLDASPKEVVTQLIVLSQIASQAPADLLDHRCSSLDQPRILELVKAAEEAHTLEKSVRETLAAYYYLDALPSLGELKAAMHMFRRGDSPFNFLKSDWRAAKKLFRSICKTKANRKATDLESQLFCIVSWIEHRAAFVADKGFKEAFGTLFKGIETDFSNIYRLHNWYVESHAKMLKCPGSIYSVDLSSLDSRKINQLAALRPRLQVRSVELDTCNKVISGLKARREAVGIIRGLSNDSDLTTMLQNLFRGIETNLEILAATLSWGEAVIKNKLVRSSSLGTLLLGTEAASNFGWAKMRLQKIVELRKGIKIKLRELGKFGAFKWRVWNRAEDRLITNNFASSFLERIKAALNSVGAVLPWSKYNANRVDCKMAGLRDFVLCLEQKKLPPLSIGSVFEFVTYRSIGRSIYKNFPELAGFSGIKHEKKRSEFVALDKEIISLTGQSFAYDIDKAKMVPNGDSGYRVSEKTEMRLLSHEFSKQSRHLPIRQLIKRAGRAIQALKPCFMMGPMSVAQYLEQDAVEFDMIVMDEASQLRPEEALGVIARGKQLVVVGDPKQLPPTNFFNRMVDDCDEDDDDTPAVLAGSESILDICQQLFHPVRTLRWHYRSQHESLIAFSNYHFYSGKLVVFPSPFERNSRLGVRYRYIKNGIYQNRQNLPEAQRVVDHVIEHMMKHQEESLGVVTLNQTQRDLIEDLLDKKLRNIEEAKEFDDKWKAEGWPFFVKNLENVQGDERDVIFISTTFGRALGTDNVRQNFGPISRPDGWRRLNVLFTRARRKIELFTSMLPEDIILEVKTPAGTRALKDYLDFAKRGVLTTTYISGREPDSDFEIAVGEMLRNVGYDVVPQLGVAGFFIDLAVRNPDRPGEYLAAIECDGAAYHSSNSARDRDRIREDILKSLGWKDRIWRIWSTDWFYDPRRESGRLLDFLKERRALVKSEPSPGYDFEDKKETTESESTTLIEEHQEATEPTPLVSAEELFVEVGDLVTYYFVDKPAERHNMMIVDTESDPNQNFINENTPLAQALLDSAVGDEVGDEPELEIKGRPTRVIRILKIQRQASDNLSPLINAGAEEGIAKEELSGTKSGRSTEFKVGERVIHPDFGAGHVLEGEGSGENTKVVVKFETFGIKKLLVKVARLERAT